MIQMLINACQTLTIYIYALAVVSCHYIIHNLQFSLLITADFYKIQTLIESLYGRLSLGKKFQIDTATISLVCFNHVKHIKNSVLNSLYYCITSLFSTAVFSDNIQLVLWQFTRDRTFMVVV